MPQCHVKVDAEVVAKHLQTKEHMNQGQPQKLKRSIEHILPGVSERKQLSHSTWYWTSSFQKTETIKSLKGRENLLNMGDQK
jgi:hypothetical protein